MARASSSGVVRQEGLFSGERRGGGGREAEEESRESATTELNRPANGSVYGVCCFELSAGFAPASDVPLATTCCSKSDIIIHIYIYIRESVTRG